MRVSKDKNDPGYNPAAFGILVFVNGQKRTRVFTADEEQGLIVVGKLNGEGMMYLDAWGEIATETLYGDVSIELPREPLGARDLPPVALTDVVVSGSIEATEWTHVEAIAEDDETEPETLTTTEQRPRNVKPANPGLLTVAPENHRLGRFT